MMGREWKPGDVAFYAGTIWGRLMKTSDGWLDTDGERRDPSATLVRPLVVIDYEDAEQVERLADAINAAIASPEPMKSTEIVQAALREFANPKPPKPDEPTGLGAVVEDADGHYWTRGANVAFPWCHATHEKGVWMDWDSVDAVRVLSDGVQP